MIRNDNPDKGTEINPTAENMVQVFGLIRNDNPDKGTEME